MHNAGEIDTWHEVAVPGEGIIGADVTVNHSHDSDLGIRSMG